MRVALPDARVELLGAAWWEETAHGLVPHRLPAWTRAQFPDAGFGLNETNPSGVRVRFATASDRVVLHAAVSQWEGISTGPIPPLRDPGVFDAVVSGEGLGEGGVVLSAAAPHWGRLTEDLQTGTIHDDPGPAAPIAFQVPGSGWRTVEIYLPFRDRVRVVAVESDGEIAAAPSSRPRWVHYGSSISHGAEAAQPTGIWPVVAARAVGVDLHNLGFGGQALLDPFVARSMRDLTADVLSIKIGINVLNHAAYGRRMFASLLHGFLDTIREGRPDVPLIVASPLFTPIGENRPGPTGIDEAMLPTVVFTSHGRAEQIADGALTLRAIREIVAEVVTGRIAAGDTALTYVDGLDLYGPGDWPEFAMADLLHPDPPAHRLIGERFAPVLAGALAR